MDVGSTCGYVLCIVDATLHSLEYLGIDWDSELGQKLRSLMADVSILVPDVVYPNGDPSQDN